MEGGGGATAAKRGWKPDAAGKVCVGVCASSPPHIASQAGMFEEAIQLYSQCISQSTNNSSPLVIKALSNRAACYKQLSNFDATISDCTAVLEAEPDNVKALVRRAQAFEAVERYKLALQDVKYVISLGINVAGQQNYKLCSQMQGRLSVVIEKMKSGNF